MFKIILWIRKIRRIFYRTGKIKLNSSQFKKLMKFNIIQNVK